MNSDELMQDKIITQLITDIRKGDPAPEEVRSAVRQLKRRLGLAPDHSPPSPRSGDSAGPTLWRRPWLRLGIAAAVIGSFTFWHSTPTGQVGAAFGQVLDVIRQATSMTYTVIEYLPDGREDMIQVEVHGSRWLRLVSAGKGTRVIDLQDSILLQFDHPRQPAKHAALFTFVGHAARALRNACVTLTDLNNVLPDDGEPLGNKTIDGQTVVGFRLRRPSLVDDLKDHSVWEIWADSDTAQVVRVDIHHERDQGGRVTLVDFKFDVQDSLFDLQPPPGYTVVYETVEEIDPVDR